MGDANNPDFVQNQFDVNSRPVRNAVLNFGRQTNTGNVAFQMTTCPNNNRQNTNEVTNVVANCGDQLNTGHVNAIESDLVSPSNQSNSTEPRNPLDYYEMGRKDDRAQKRGRCLILNYKNFYDPNLNTRDGTEYDVGSLSATFGGQNLDVIPHHNKTRKETEDILVAEAQFDHSKYHCFILCILSHGESGKFFCKDQPLEYEQVFRQFNGSNCRTLVGKPKLFIIQACQGSNSDPGVMIDSNQVLVSDSALRLLPNNPQTRPITADMLAFFCSCPDYFSLRIKIEGSWFIQDFCQVFNQFANGEDLESVLTKVKDRVTKREAEEFTQAGWNPIKQMPRFESTLTRKVQF